MNAARLIFGSLLLVLSTGPILAQGAIERGTITVSRGWSRATVSAMAVGAGYMIIANRGSEPDRLLSLSTPAAERVEIHRTTVEDRIVRMRQVTDGLVIPPNSSVELAPSGLHLMLVQLKHPLRAGALVPLTLVFERAGTIATSLAIVQMGGLPPKE